jgi:hypothetical protein
MLLYVRRINGAEGAIGPTDLELGWHVVAETKVGKWCIP